jgi:hypothetical protein
MKQRAATYVQNVGESACSCLITMVQGDLLSLGLSHWITASETGLVAGTVASAAIISVRLRRPWLIALALGIATTFADYSVHPGHIGSSPVMEAAVTGLGAMALSLVFGLSLRRLKRMRTGGPAGTTSAPF